MISTQALGRHLERLATAIRAENSLEARVYEVAILAVGARAAEGRRGLEGRAARLRQQRRHGVGAPERRAQRVRERARAGLVACVEFNLQPDFNVRICDSFDASSSAVLRELDESTRFIQKSAKSTSM